MPTIAPEIERQSRATPKKLGLAPRNSANARDEFYRQLDFLVKSKELDVKTRDFLVDALYTWSDKTAKDFYPSQKTMAEKRQCHIRTVQRRVRSARLAGVLKVAQLKGFDKGSQAWFCSSNTHRPTFVVEWVVELDKIRAARQATKRQERIEAKATPKSRNYRPGETRPSVPDVDLEEIEARQDLRAPDDVRRARARDMRALLTRERPPPS